MKKAMAIVGAVGATLVLMLAFASVASADNGPHGNFGPGDTTSTTDSCAGCHRAHTATGDNLLRWGSFQYQFCTQCHGPLGAGAVTDVVDGEIQAVSDLYGYTSPDATSAQVTPHSPLNGGGFEYMQMYIPATDETLPAAVPTSKHRVEGLDGGSGNVVAWGGGDNNSGPGITGFLQCSSCHDPHGSPNYRILQPGYRNGSAYSTSWTPSAGYWPAEYIDSRGQEPMVGSNEILPGAHNYAAGLNVYYDYGISDFCGGCHQQYLINGANGYDAYNTYDSGDGQTVVRYRHAVTSKGYYATGTQQWVTVTNGFRADAAFVPFAQTYPPDPSGRALRRTTEYYGGSRTWATMVTDGGNYNGTMITCLTCHYAHGSAAQASNWAGNVAPTNDSANLYLDNRGVCQACHAKGAAPGEY